MKRVRYFLFRYKLIWIVLLCAMALLLFSASTTHAQQQSLVCPRQHPVQFGQNLFRIGLSYGYTTGEMWAVNPTITNPNVIYAGTWINVPPCNFGQGGGPIVVPPIYYTCRIYHTVAPQQTLTIIGGYYGVDPNVIAQVNGIADINVIHVGRMLCIP